MDPVAVARETLTITVHGAPITQGSKTRTRWGMRDDNGDRLAPWREAVKWAALSALEKPGGHDMAGAWALSLVFTMRRPESVPVRKRRYPTAARSGDLDKLCRAVMDALTDAGVWLDDSQCVTLRATKRYAGDPAPGVMSLPGVVIELVRHE